MCVCDMCVCVMYVCVCVCVRHIAKKFGWFLTCFHKLWYYSHVLLVARCGHVDDDDDDGGDDIEVATSP